MTIESPPNKASFHSKDGNALSPLWESEIFNQDRDYIRLMCSEVPTSDEEKKLNNFFILDLKIEKKEVHHGVTKIMKLKGSKRGGFAVGTVTKWHVEFERLS